jgi:hypothetical protein
MTQGVMFDDTSARKVKEFVNLLTNLERLCEIQVSGHDDTDFARAGSLFFVWLRMVF